MSRAFACLFAVVTLLAASGHAQAQNYDIMSGGPSFFGGGGSGPIARTLVSFDSGYAPGTIYISTAERRLYLVSLRRPAGRRSPAQPMPPARTR